MTASGPFAMGPALAGNSSRRSVPRSNFTPVPIPGSGPPPGSTIGRNCLAAVKAELDGNAHGGAKKNAEDDEVYSEPDEGVEIIDMEDISQMDWMAPESLRKQHHMRKIKKEEPVEFSGRPSTVFFHCYKPNPLLSKQQRAQSTRPMHSTLARVKKKRNWKISSNILWPERMLSRSFVPDSLFGFECLTSVILQTTAPREERLYLFQFPSPFPSFAPPGGFPPPPPTDGISDGAASSSNSQPVPLSVKGEPGSLKTAASRQQMTATEPTLDGVIGELLVYRSGAVKMRLASGILLDVCIFFRRVFFYFDSDPWVQVNAATQPSFLQQAVHLDMTSKRLVVLGEVNKRFSVSPDVDALLTAMELQDKIPSMSLDGQELITMDTT